MDVSPGRHRPGPVLDDPGAGHLHFPRDVAAGNQGSHLRGLQGSIHRAPGMGREDPGVPAGPVSDEWT